MTVVLYSTAAMAAGFILDLLLGDPPGMPHIIRAVGALISSLEKFLRRVFPKTQAGEIIGGTALCAAVIAICFGVSFAVLYAAYSVSRVFGFVLESLLCYQLLAAKCLASESCKVYKALRLSDTELARKRIAMLVGRDTDTLDNAGITRAAVETVAENTSDGVIAPMFYIMLGGAPLGLIYKAVNTMDSMVGYKNDRYLYFGRTAAKLDDVLNYIPARLAAVLMLLSAAILKLDAQSAEKIWRRDRRKHDSPNSAQTESVCAGALGVRLAGPNKYFGVVKDKPYIGDDLREIVPEDILRTNRLMYAAAVLMLIFALLLRGIIYAYAAI